MADGFRIQPGFRDNFPVMRTFENIQQYLAGLVPENIDQNLDDFIDSLTDLVLAMYLFRWKSAPEVETDGTRINYGPTPTIQITSNTTGYVSWVDGIPNDWAGGTMFVACTYSNETAAQAVTGTWRMRADQIGDNLLDPDDLNIPISFPAVTNSLDIADIRSTTGIAIPAGASGTVSNRVDIDRTAGGGAGDFIFLAVATVWWPDGFPEPTL